MTNEELIEKVAHLISKCDMANCTHKPGTWECTLCLALQIITVIKEAERERIKRELREHWTGYNTVEAPNWVTATLSGTQEDIEKLLGKL